MPTRKQRRRQQKLRRHEWEEVWVDEEGNEIPVDDPDARAAAVAKSNGRSREERAKPAPSRRGARDVPPPSWRRVLKRAAIFLPLMYLVISFTGPEQNAGINFLIAAWWTMLLIPFMYLMDRVKYRAYLRRTGTAAGEPARRR